MGPNALIVREEPVEGPTRRRVYEPATVGYVVTVEAWRLSLKEWHTLDSHRLETVAVDRPEGHR